MKKTHYAVMALITLALILIGSFAIGKNWDQWKVNKLMKHAPPDPIVLGYNGTGGLIPPAGSIIEIDTINKKIYIVDSVWIDYQNKLRNQ